jgi:hypothetical protein
MTQISRDLIVNVLAAIKKAGGFSGNEIEAIIEILGAKCEEDITTILSLSLAEGREDGALAADSAYSPRGRSAVAEMQAIRRAEAAVGGGPFAADSAAGVYGEALKAMGVSIRGVHPSAYQGMYEMAQRRQTGQTAAPVRASDSGSFAKRFPDAPRVRQM